MANKRGAARRGRGAEPWHRAGPRHGRQLHQLLRPRRHRLGVVRHAAEV